MNILFVIPDLDTGGAQTFLIRLAIQLKKEGHKVHVYDIHPSKRNEKFYQALNKEVPVIGAFYGRLKAWSGKVPWGNKVVNGLNSRLSLQDRLNRWQIKKLYRANNIEIVNSHMYLADIFVAKMFQDIEGVKLVSSFHGCYSFIQKEIKEGGVVGEYRNIFLQQVKQVLKQFSGFIYVTSHQLNFPEGIPFSAKKKEKIYYGYQQSEKGFTTDLLPDKDKDEVVTGMVARGDKTKGWEELILAFIKAKERNAMVKARLCLVGGGKFIDELKEEYQRPDIHFIGNVSDPMPYIRSFDVAALPTYFPAESLPNSVIEYLVAGKPVIATDIAEIPFMLKNDKGETAGFVTSLNEQGKADVAQLSAALEQYFLNPALLEEHSVVAKEAFKKFNMETCVNNYLRFFREVVSEEN